MLLDLKIISLIIPFLNLIFLVLFHVFIQRITPIFIPIKSRQNLLIHLIIIFDCFLILTLLYFNLIFLNLDFFYSSVYIFLVSNLGAYIYFHIFNLSETGRRVKLLATIKKNKNINFKKINKHYSEKIIIDNRLDRLLSMNKISLVDNKYYIKKSNLLLIAKVIRFFGVIFVGKNRKNLS